MVSEGRTSPGVVLVLLFDIERVQRGPVRMFTKTSTHPKRFRYSCESFQGNCRVRGIASEIEEYTKKFLKQVQEQKE